MKENCYIDGINIYQEYGVWITKGGYNGLLNFPEMKEPPKNDWPEEDGIEVDLETPTLSNKIVSISFLASKQSKSVEDFLNFISIPGYHALYIPTLKREWRIRLSEHPSNRAISGVTAFTLKFIEDIVPRRDSLPNPGISVVQSSYELDNIPFNFYGVVVDEGKNNVLSSPTVKTNLTRKILKVDGLIYDSEHLVFNTKDVTLKCRFKAKTIDQFWSCYDSFFSALTKSGERSLYVDYTGEEYPCYYKSASGFRIITLSAMVMVEFSLTLVFTSFRINGVDYILSSENGEWIVLEEDGETPIDMKFSH